MRISIDTGELHTLAGVYRREADDLNRTAAKLRAHNGTALNHQDPAIRAADVPRRVAGLATRSDQIANNLRTDATNFDHIANTMEHDQGGGLLRRPPFMTPVPMPMPIGVWPIGKIGRIDPDQVTRIGRPFDPRRPRFELRPEDRFVNGLRDALRRFQRGATNSWAAGKRAATSIFGQVRDLGRSVAGAIHRFGNRVAHFTAAAWTRGRDFAARTYRTVVDGIRRCISAAGQAFQSALHTITTTGKFIADTATFTWDLIKSLPGHALDAFKKLHKALVELPVWKYVRQFNDWMWRNAQWVHKKGGEAFNYLYGPPKPFTPPTLSPPASLGDGVEVTKVETDTMAAELTAVLGFKPSIGITKTTYSDGTVDVTFEEEFEVSGGVGVGGKIGGVALQAGGGANGKIKHKKTWRFPGPDGDKKANEFIQAAKQRYIRELSRWVALMGIPFGHLIALGSGAPSLIGEGTDLWGTALSEEWGGGLGNSASATAGGGVEKAEASRNEGGTIGVKENKLDGSRTYSLGTEVGLSAGIFGPLRAAAGAGFSTGASVRTDRNGNPTELSIEAELLLTAEAGMDLFGAKAQAGSIYKVKVEGSVPLNAHHRALAERAIRGSSAALQELMSAVGSDVELTVSWGRVTSSDFEYGASGKVIIKVGGSISGSQSTYTPEGSRRMKISELIALMR